MPIENVHPTWQEQLLRDVDAVEDSFYAHPLAEDLPVLTDPRTEAGVGVVTALHTENVSPTWQQHVFHEEPRADDLFHYEDPAAAERAVLIAIEQRALREQEERDESDALSRFAGEGGSGG